MSDTVVTVNDATHDNIGRLPGGLAAGYSTGSGGVPWTAADWASHPDAVRIDQDPAASDPTADVLDVENGAATFADCPGWAKRALADFKAGARKGQRTPAIYVSRSQVTQAVNALEGGGVTSGVGLWIADWNNDRAAAAAEITGASGPFPVIGRQYENAGAYDVSVFSGNWLANQAGGAQPGPAPTTAPAFPYPATDYLGLESADPHCHSGYNATDQPHIRTWQGQMAHRGWTLSVDGIYGTQSQSVAQAFQAEKGLAADGKVGPVTWKASWTAPVT